MFSDDHRLRNAVFGEVERKTHLRERGGVMGEWVGDQTDDLFGDVSVLPLTAHRRQAKQGCRRRGICRGSCSVEEILGPNDQLVGVFARGKLVGTCSGSAQ